HPGALGGGPQPGWHRARAEAGAAPRAHGAARPRPRDRAARDARATRGGAGGGARRARADRARAAHVDRPCAASRPGGADPLGEEEHHLMAVDKPTERAQEAIAGSARIAGERGNPVVEPDHLLAALLEAREGVVEPLLSKAGADLPALRAAVD